MIPSTSTTLLRAIAGDSRNVRWTEFVERYRPMMEKFLQERFPQVDADEVIQATLVALMSALPKYRYSPDEKGAFHNYLTGILRNKACRLLKAEMRRGKVQREYADDPTSKAFANGGKLWQEALFELALQQLLADDTVQPRTKQVFVRTAVNGESPEKVAEAFGIKRNAVDQIKNRTLAKLREIAERLEKAAQE